MLKYLVLIAVLSGTTAVPAASAANAPSESAPVTPEPTGYWTGPTNSPVPATLTGGTVISSVHRLRALLSHKDIVLIDVSNAPKRPDNMAPGAPWLPLPHRAIPGAAWMPGVR